MSCSVLVLGACGMRRCTSNRASSLVGATRSREDSLRAEGERRGLTRRIWRPQFVFGGSIGAMNLVPVLGAYTAHRRYEGESFSFSGGASDVAEAWDARLIAAAIVWATKTAAAKSAYCRDFAFAYGSDGRNNSPAFVSTVKLRGAGITAGHETEDAFGYGSDDLGSRRLLPLRDGST